jgi:hypothetical protein
MSTTRKIIAFAGVLLIAGAVTTADAAKKNALRVRVKVRAKKCRN